MTTKQQQLLETLADRGIKATFSGQWLNGVKMIRRANGKTQKQSFGIVFDDAAELEGPRVATSRGTYGESFARDAFFEAILIGQGDEAALHFARECREQGIRIGASQGWIDRHIDAGTLAPIAN